MFVKNRRDKKIAVALFAVLLVLFGFGFPGLLLVHKPANTQEAYVSGWQAGCQSGASAYAPLRSFFGEQPFVRDLKGGDLYKEAWNEAYSSCRFAQSAWYDLVGLIIIVLALYATRYRGPKK